MCKHLFVPPFWKYNRFCLLCGRLRDLRVGNSVILDDSKISFSGDVDLTGVRQIGFNSNSRLVFHDGLGQKIALCTDELSDHQIVRIDEWVQSEVLISNTINEVVITNRVVQFDFNIYRYFVINVIPRNKAVVFEFTNTAYNFRLRLYPWQEYSTNIYVEWLNNSYKTAGYIIRIVYHPHLTSGYYRGQFYVKDRLASNIDYVVSGGSRRRLAGGLGVIGSAQAIPPNQIKLTGQWSVTGRTFVFYDSYFVVYGYR